MAQLESFAHLELILNGFRFSGWADEDPPFEFDFEESSERTRGADGGLYALAPADQAGVPGQPRGGGQEEVAIEAGEARDLRDHRLRVREDGDERAALQRAHQLVAAALQDLPRCHARPRERVDHARVAVRGVLLRGVEELADAAEHALRIDRDRLVVEAGGRVEDRVVIDRDVGQGASDGEQAHGSAPSPEASRSSIRSA